MPYPDPSNWFAVMGSGPNALSEIAQQQAGFGRTNLDTAKFDIGQLNQAQAAQNSWLSQLAQLQRQDVARADALARQDQGDIESQIDRAKAFAQRAHEFDVGTQLTREDQAARSKERDWHLAIRDADQQRDLKTHENTAKFLAEDAQNYANAFKDSAKELRQATDELDTSASKVESSPKIAFARSKQFAPSMQYLNDPEANKIAAEANAKLATSKSRYDQAVENYKLHLSNWNDLKKRAAQNQLQIGDDGTVYSPFQDKKYGSPISSTPEKLGADWTALGDTGWYRPTAEAGSDWMAGRLSAGVPATVTSTITPPTTFTDMARGAGTTPGFSGFASSSATGRVRWNPKTQRLE